MKLKYTYSSLFLFPLLGLPQTLFNCFHYVGKELRKTRYVNTYLDDYQSDWTGDYLGVVYANYGDKNAQAFEDTLESLPNFIRRYDIVDGHFTVAVFSIPDEYLADYNSFLQGAYSKYTKPARTLCLEQRPPDLIDGYKFLNNIFTKDPELKKELEDKIYLDPTDHLPDDVELFSIYEERIEILSEGIREKLRNSIPFYGTVSRLEGPKNLGKFDAPIVGEFLMLPPHQ